VLRVITRLNVGGPAINASILTARLDPSRFETLLVTGREGPTEGSMAELGRLDPGLAPIRIDSLQREISPINDLRVFAQLVRLIRRYRPHVVHTHLAKAGLLGRLAAAADRVPVIIHTYHGSVFRGYFGTTQSAAYLRLERALATVTSRVIAITPLQEADLIHLRVAPAEKIVRIPLGLDLAQFSGPRDPTASRRMLGIPTDRPVLGIVARLVPIKDVATFLRGAALVRRRLPQVHTVVIGDGELRHELRGLARELFPDGACSFVGWQADMGAVLAALDVVGLTSLNEGSPVSLIEALAAGRAVVATRVGGVPDVVRDGATGFLVPPRDPEAFAAACVRLLEEPALRSEFGALGRQEVADRFGAERLVTDVQALYEGLVPRR